MVYPFMYAYTRCLFLPNVLLQYVFRISRKLHAFILFTNGRYNFFELPELNECVHTCPMLKFIAKA